MYRNENTLTLQKPRWTPANSSIARRSGWIWRILDHRWYWYPGDQHGWNDIWCKEGDIDVTDLGAHNYTNMNKAEGYYTILYCTVQYFSYSQPKRADQSRSLERVSPDLIVASCVCPDSINLSIYPSEHQWKPARLRSCCEPISLDFGRLCSWPFSSLTELVIHRQFRRHEFNVKYG